jgi:putative ABC transport system permease protein
MSWINRLMNLFRRDRLHDEVDEELEFHLEARIRENLAKGLTGEQATQDALRRLGGHLQAQEKTRDADLLVGLETMGRDIRFALRNLRKNPGVTAVAALSLALGIGANTAIFSAIHGTLLRPLPYRDPGRLAMLWLDNRRLGLHEDLTSYPNYEDWKKNRAFADLAGFVPTDSILTGLEEPVRVADALVTSNFFSVLGVQPAVGHSFNLTEEEPERGRVVILSQGLWRRQFASDPQVLGKTLELNGRPHQIIGVMPSGFAFPSKETQLWRPLAQTPRQRANRGGFFLSVVGRLKPGVTWEQARKEMRGIGAHLEAVYPDQDKGYGVWVVPLLDQVVGKMRQALLALLAAVAFVLLIACVNVANLFLGRAAVRGREIALRGALGAGRARLVRQLLTESIVLSMMAGVLGLALAFCGIRGLVLLAPPDLPRLDEISINGPVLAFTLTISAIAGILFGLVPAFRISRVDLNEALREGGRSQAGGKRLRYLRSGLTVAEVAFSMVLLTGAGLMIRSLLSLRAVYPGFRTDNVLTWRISVSRTKYTQAPQVTAFYTELLGRLQSVPGVQGAAAITDVFLSITPNSAGFTVDGHILPRRPSSRLRPPSTRSV